MSREPPPLPIATASSAPAGRPAEVLPQAIPVAAVVQYGLGDYRVRRTPPGGLWWTSFIGSIFVAAASLLLFLALSVTQSLGWAILGFLWLWLAVLIVLVSLALGIIYAAMAASNDYPPPGTRLRARLAWGLPAINVVLVLMLTLGGLSITRAANLNVLSGPTPPPAAPPAKPGYPTLQLSVTNPSSSRIDTATVVLPDGSRHAIGQILPYGTQVRVVHLAGDGPLTIQLLRRDGRRWQQVIDPYVVHGTTQTPTVSLMLQPSSGTPLAEP